MICGLVEVGQSVEFELAGLAYPVKKAFSSQLSRFTVGFDGPDRNYFNLGVGLAATLPNGWSAFGNFETVAGLRDTTSHVVTLGGRLEF